MQKNWDTQQMPDQSGKIVIITGGNTGLGYQMSLELAKKNASIIIACRSKVKGIQAIGNIENTLGKKIDAQVIELDLTSMDSIHSFVSTFKQSYTRLDILINNAGVVNLKERVVTSNGAEMHMATNHLGHFALTGLLYPIIIATPHARVMTMSSGSHKFGDINFDDINWEKRPYDRSTSYGDSKLANLLFVRSLQERFDKDKASAISVAAHPGLSATERQQSMGIGGYLTKILAQPVYMGALPALKAATAKEVKALEYYGPKYGVRGYPRLAGISKKALDKQVAQKLWQYSEQMTGVKFDS